MDEVVRIEPLVSEPGLIGYECPACSYVASVVLRPRCAPPLVGFCHDDIWSIE